MSEPETKKCPYCAEEINIEAIKCKHCKSDLDGGVSSSIQAKKVEVITTENSFLTRSRGCADILIFGPLLLILIMFFIKGCI